MLHIRVNNNQYNIYATNSDDCYIYVTKNDDCYTVFMLQRMMRNVIVVKHVYLCAALFLYCLYNCSYFVNDDWMHPPITRVVGKLCVIY